MINANLEQFLDTGWFSEATLYLNGYTYWCEGSWDYSRKNPKRFRSWDMLFVIIKEVYHE